MRGKGCEVAVVLALAGTRVLTCCQQGSGGVVVRTYVAGRNGR
jgi:hypothetical protein